jgi:hypothetical protein
LPLTLTPIADHWELALAHPFVSEAAGWLTMTSPERHLKVFIKAMEEQGQIAACPQPQPSNPQFLPNFFCHLPSIGLGLGGWLRRVSLIKHPSMDSNAKNGAKAIAIRQQQQQQQQGVNG